MPVPIGRSGVRSISTPTAPTETTAPVAPPTTEAPQGWSAGRQSRPGVDQSVATPTASAADIQSTMPNPVKQAMQKSVDKFTGRIEATLHHDASSIARGQKPIREGDPMTDAQQKELQSAATDFVKDMPIGALAPDVAAAVQSKLKDAGVEVRDIASTRLGDLGQIGGDIAKDLVKDLRTNSPTAFYSLAATGAAAIGYMAWNDGSAKLNRLGVKPEIKQNFFDDKLQVKLKGDWQAHFKDFTASGTVGTAIKLGDAGKLSASVSGNSKTGFESAQAGYNFDRPNLNLSATAAFDQTGFKSAAVNGAYHDDTLSVSGAVTANAKGLESASGRVAWNPNPNFNLSAGVDHNFQTDRTTATADANWKVKQNLDLSLSASHDSAGESRAGVGLTFRF